MNYFGKHLKARLPMYFIGLFVISLGITMSVKANQGVTPVSAIPYTLTLVCGIELGNATIIFQIILLAIQFLILRRDFRITSLLQILVSVVFGKFTTLAGIVLSFVPPAPNVPASVIYVILGIMGVAIGVFLYAPTNIMPLPAEGMCFAITKKTRIAFHNSKIIGDVSYVAVSFLICMVAIKSPGSVGIGTIAAAVFVGVVVKFLTKFFGRRRDVLYGYIPDIHVKE